MVESKYYYCNVYHSRINPVKHTFTYSVFYFVIDLDELENGLLDNYLFGYNKTRVITINNTDYMGKEDRPIKEKLLERFKIHQLNNNNNNNINSSDQININSIKRVKLITNPRYFNYSFNPVNFYYCYDENNNLLQVVAEINNTFGETHLYFPTPTEFRDEHLKYPFKTSIGEHPFLKRYSINKDFHVSPFNSLDGAYDFYFGDLDKCFDIRINLMSSLNSPTLNIINPLNSNSNNNDTNSDSSDSNNNNNNNNNNTNIDNSSSISSNKEIKSFYDYILMTRLWSTTKPSEINSTNILKLLFNYPIAAFKTVPRILYQAGLLHWSKNLKIYAKPNPPLENTTILIKPSSNELSAYQFFLDYIKRFKNINIELLLPNSDIVPINTCDSDSGEPIKVTIYNYEFFWRLFLLNKTTSASTSASVQLKAFSSKAIGLSYMCQDFTCDRLPELLIQLCDLTISTTTATTTTSSININQKGIWNDLSEFINIENIYSFFLFNHTNQIQQQYNFNSYNQYKEVLDQLGISGSVGTGKSIEILEIGCNLSYYLINEGYLNNNNNIKLTILIESKELYQYHISTLNNKYSNVQFINMNLTSYINSTKNNNNNNNNKFDTIILIESNLVNLNTFNQYLNSLRLISKVKSNIFIQNINKSGNNLDKPNRISSFKNNYCRLIDQIGRKYWALMANFQHNPFYLEERYLDLMNILCKSSINGHINDESDDTQSNESNEAFKYYLEHQQDSNEFKLKSFNNIDNSGIITIIEDWIQQANNNKSIFSIKIQEMVMRRGCQLKMNMVEIDEIYRAIIYHLSLLLSSFKNNNLQLSNFIIENN